MGANKNNYHFLKFIITFNLIGVLFVITYKYFYIIIKQKGYIIDCFM